MGVIGGGAVSGGVPGGGTASGDVIDGGAASGGMTGGGAYGVSKVTPQYASAGQGRRQGSRACAFTWPCPP